MLKIIRLEVVSWKTQKNNFALIVGLSLLAYINTVAFVEKRGRLE